MQWISNNLNWLIYVVIFVIPVLSSVGKWIQQQAAKKQAEAERRRRADAQLRTGRPDASETVSRPAPSPASRDDRDPPETFADRRRRQIEELKRRQEAAQRQRDAAQRTSPAPTPAPTPTAGRRPVERRRAQPSSEPIASAAPSVAAPSAEIETLAAKFEREAGAQRAAAQAKRKPAQQAGPLRVGPGLDRATLRNAVVLAEVLAPPVGLRDGSQRVV
jgi:FtsZ-interacting cell division protein ZipA